MVLGSNPTKNSQAGFRLSWIQVSKGCHQDSVPLGPWPCSPPLAPFSGGLSPVEPKVATSNSGPPQHINGKRGPRCVTLEHVLIPEPLTVPMVGKALSGSLALCLPTAVKGAELPATWRDWRVLSPKERKKGEWVQGSRKPQRRPLQG